jgi:hypothetical protein
MEKVFKIGILLVGFAICILLWLIYQKSDNQRYQLSGDTLIDTKTGQLYIWGMREGYITFKDGKSVHLKELPRNEQ